MWIIRSPQSRQCPLILFCFLLTFLTDTETAYSQNRELSERGKAADTNKDGLIQRSEARGPLEANFDDMDCDKNGGLDGAEIRGFFTGTGCPEKKLAKIANKSSESKYPPLSERGKAADTNKDGLIQRSEARGPLEANFDDMDCDKNGGLDGAEIRGFFTGTGCPEKNYPKIANKSSESKYPPLSERGKAADTNKDGLIQRSEARGPLEANFDDMDCDKNGGLDGAEIRGFFTGTGCPEKTASKPDNKNKKKKAASSGSRRPPPAVKLATVVSEIAGETYKVAGRVIALQSGSLSTRVSGTIKRISVEVGDRVTEGYIIAKLRDGRIRADRKKALALLKRQQVALKNAVRELNRIKRLRKSAAYSRARFEELEGQVAERRSQVSEVSAALERIEIDVRDTVIKAPFSGVITQKHVEKGTHVNTGSPIVTLINDNKVEIEVDVPSFRISSISSATLANLFTRQWKQGTHSG